MLVRKFSFRSLSSLIPKPLQSRDMQEVMINLRDVTLGSSFLKSMIEDEPDDFQSSLIISDFSQYHSDLEQSISTLSTGNSDRSLQISLISNISFCLSSCKSVYEFERMNSSVIELECLVIKERLNNSELVQLIFEYYRLFYITLNSRGTYHYGKLPHEMGDGWIKFLGMLASSDLLTTINGKAFDCLVFIAPLYERVKKFNDESTGQSASSPLMSIFNMMKTSKVKANRETYQRMIDAFANSMDENRSSTCLKLLHEYQEQFGEPAPSLSYKHALNSCRDLGAKFDINNAVGHRLLEKIWEEAVQAHGTDSELCEGLIRYFLRKPGKLSKIKEIFNDMVANNIPRSIFLYNSLIKACYLAEDFEYALKILELIKRDGLKPNRKTYFELLLASRSQSFQVSKYIFESYLSEYPIPDLMFCNSYLNCMLNRKRYTQAFNFIRTMKNTYGIIPSVITFQQIMSETADLAFHNSKLCRIAFRMLPSYNLSPTVELFSKLVRVYLKEGSFAEAEKVLMEALNYFKWRGKVIPDTYSLIFIEILLAYGDVNSSYAMARYYFIYHLAQRTFHNRIGHHQWLNRFSVKHYFKKEDRYITAVKADYSLEEEQFSTDFLI